MLQAESTDPSDKEAPSCTGVYDKLIELAVQDILSESDSLREREAHEQAEGQYQKEVVLEECSFSSPAEIACMVAARSQEEFESCDGATEAEDGDGDGDGDGGEP